MEISRQIAGTLREPERGIIFNYAETEVVGELEMESEMRDYRVYVLGSQP